MKKNLHNFLASILLRNVEVREVGRVFWW